MKRILATFNTKHKAILSAVVSRSGVPIAWETPEGVKVDAFATLTATLLGASEVVCSGIQRKPPRRVLVESENGVLVAKGIGPRAFLVAVMPKGSDAAFQGMEESAAAIQNVLRGQS